MTTEPYVTAADLAEYLSLSTSTILDRWERGELPGVKIGRAVRFRISEVEAVLECRRGPVKPQQAPGREASDLFYAALNRRNGIPERA